jgi:hypothetical protein
MMLKVKLSILHSNMDQKIKMVLLRIENNDNKYCQVTAGQLFIN